MHGTESFVSATVTDQFKVRFDYTTTRTRDETTDLGVLRRPGNKASVAAVWTPLNELTIAATLVHVSSWVDVNRDTAVFIPRLDAPAYTTFNLAANYIVNKTSPSLRARTISSTSNIRIRSDFCVRAWACMGE